MSATFNSAEGRPVVAADTAESLGEVKGFVVDPTASRVEAVHVSGRGRKAEVVPWTSVHSFGDDAVVAEQADSTEQVSTDYEKAAVKGKIAAVGSRVLSTAGFEIGTVEDVMFDTGTGELTGVLTEGGRIAADRLRSLGSYALVVDPE